MKTNRQEDIIKVFGMSNQLATHGLNEIESKFQIDLGHGQKKSTLDDSYSLFEQEVRSEAALMGTYYEMFYCLEKSIRKLIDENLTEEAGENWWDSSKVPQKIQQDVRDRIQKEIDSGVTRRSDNPLDYTTFGELSQIITSNWGVFGTIFQSPKAVERVISNLNTLRGPIAHCSKLAEDEVVRLKLSLRDWFRIMQ